MAATRAGKAKAFREYVEAALACQHAAAELNDLVVGSEEHTRAQAALDQACALVRETHERWLAACGR